MPDTKIVTIAGEQFELPQPYAEGHTLTAHEANAMNQLFCENIGNNRRKVVQAAKDAAEAEGKEFDPKTLQAEIAEYAASYDFSQARAPAAVVDPVDKMAVKIATNYVRAALQAKGTLGKYVGKNATDEDRERYRAQITKLATENEEIRKEAKKEVAKESKRAESAAELIDL